MILTFVEVPIDVQGSPFADSRNSTYPDWPAGTLALADRHDGPLPGDDQIETRPTAVMENRFRPGGRVETRPAGLNQPRQGTYAIPSRGAAIAAAVQFIVSRTNDDTLDTDIQRRLRHLRPQAANIMRQHRYGGLLAVATVIVSFDPSSAFWAARPGERPSSTVSEGRRCDAVYLTERVFALPMHAISVWRHSSYFGPGIAEQGQSLENRFFWGEWT